MSDSRLLVQARFYECDSDLKTCRTNWPDDPASWCEGCLILALADEVEHLPLTVLTCLQCGKMTIPLEAELRTFNGGLCACGGSFRVHVEGV